MDGGVGTVPELTVPAFDLDRVEAADGVVTVTGRWRGVRGRRFMRPSLSVAGAGEGDRALADLEHKPWPAQDGEPWLAVFPWKRELADEDVLELTVAPDLTVRLSAGGESKAAPRPSAAKTKLREALTERDAARLERRDALDDRERALADLHQAVQARRQAETSRDALADERDSLARERDRVAAERDAARQEIARLAHDLELAGVRATAEGQALQTQLDVAKQELIATNRDLTAAQKDLAAAEKDLTALRSERASEPAPIASLHLTEPAAPVPPRPRRPDLVWDVSPYARTIAVGSVAAVALILLAILVLR